MTQTWELHVLRTLWQASWEGIWKSAQRIRIQDTRIRTMSRITVDSKTKKPILDVYSDVITSIFGQANVFTECMWEDVISAKSQAF